MAVHFTVLTLLYTVALAWLLWVARRNRAHYALAKGVCSSLFLVVALVGFYLGNRQAPANFAFLFAALLLCAAGDVLLGLANKKAQRLGKKPFYAGAGSFMLAHLLFLFLFFRYATFRWYNIALPALLAVAMVFFEKSGKVRMKKARPLGYCYAVLIGFMAGKAFEVAVVSSSLSSASRGLVAAGAALFLASDILLMFLYFGTTRRRWLRPANLLTYYVGIYFMALLALWM